MDREGFERYLKMKGFMGKTVPNIASRCVRVEKAFQLNLDDVLRDGQFDALIQRVKADEGRKRMNYVGSDVRWYVSNVVALQKYKAFRQGGDC